MTRIAPAAALRALRAVAQRRNPALQVFFDPADAETIVIAVQDEGGPGRVLRRLDAASAQDLARALDEGRGMLARVI